MEVQSGTQTEPFVAEMTPPGWSLPKRIGFRFILIYFGLFVFPFPLYFLPFNFVGTLLGKYQELVRFCQVWVGEHVVHHPVIFARTGSGDTAAAWVRILCFLFAAFVGTVIWSALDRKRKNYVTLNNWFLLFVRLSLASAMFGYGLTKVIPTQMPAPNLARLLEPLGDFSPMGLLWNFIGASKAYEIIVGSAEVLAGVFLIFPRTTALGACVAIMDMLYVFILNMCFDVSVKQYSFHLMLLGILLLAPDIRALINFFFFRRKVKPYVPPPFFRYAWANWIVLLFQIWMGFYFVKTNIKQDIAFYHQARTKPPLYGIWTVDEFSADGQVHPPLLTDDLRWQRVLFPVPDDFRVQYMNGKFQRYTMELDLPNKKATLKKFDDPKWSANLNVEKTSPDTLEIKGQVDSHFIDAKTKHAEDPDFLLYSRGFHWITEISFNR